MLTKTNQTIREYFKEHPWYGLDTPEEIAEDHRNSGHAAYADALMEAVRLQDEEIRRSSPDSRQDNR